jgi:hypothetical protein
MSYNRPRQWHEYPSDPEVANMPLPGLDGPREDGGETPAQWLERRYDEEAARPVNSSRSVTKARAPAVPVGGRGSGSDLDYSLPRSHSSSSSRVRSTPARSRRNR